MRFLQYLSTLQEAGIEVDVSPLFSNSYVRVLQRGDRAVAEVFRSYSKRLFTILTARKYDLIWIEKECLPWFPAWTEWLLLSSRIPVVLDYDDAVFHDYEKHRYLLIRRLLGNKHSRIIKRAALVIAGNQYLADYALRSGAPKVIVLPTAIDLNRYSQDLERSNEDAVSMVKVVWIGQHYTAKFLRPLAPLFEKIAAEGKARFSAIGIDTNKAGLPMASIQWSEEIEASAIAEHDIGIMPLEDGPFERGKCGYKLIQYMACGLPVVASPVGVNRQIVEHGVNGYLAESLDDWETAIKALAADPELRKKLGVAGRRKVESDYCIQVTGPVLVELLESVVSGANRNRQ
jgi:glycosyltransferase involved in cell wall biosynthesis